MFRNAFARIRRFWRSAITGRFVSKDFAKSNPDTTVSGTIREDD